MQADVEMDSAEISDQGPDPEVFSFFQAHDY